jgi:hypothetical protein
MRICVSLEKRRVVQYASLTIRKRFSGIGVVRARIMQKPLAEKIPALVGMLINKK